MFLAAPWVKVGEKKPILKSKITDEKQKTLTQIQQEQEKAFKEQKQVFFLNS